MLPSVSAMEAWSVFEDERRRRNAFRQTLDQQISQLRRDETSPHAKALLQYLQLAYEENDDLLNDVDIRLRDILSKLSGLQPGFSAASLLPLTQEVFLSGNIKDLQTPDIEVMLAAAGISRYFARTEDFLGWFQSQKIGLASP